MSLFVLFVFCSQDFELMLSNNTKLHATVIKILGPTRKTLLYEPRFRRSVLNLRGEGYVLILLLSVQLQFNFSSAFLLIVYSV